MREDPIEMKELAKALLCVIEGKLLAVETLRLPLVLLDLLIIE